MSLAMYAAPFDNESESSNNKDKDNNNEHGRKKIMNNNNKTQKRYPSLPGNNSEKVMSVLQSMNNLPPTSDDMGDFSPIPPPTSVGVQSTILRDQGIALKNKGKQNQSQNQNQNISNKFQSNIQPNISSNVYSNLQSNTYSNLNDSEEGYDNMYDSLASPSHAQSNEEYYRKYVPNYEEMYKNSGYYKNNNNNTGSSTSNDVLIEKLNYMIHLLEESQDERTSNVTEEVILYSFLGIFIIFIVDSFARVGKYTR